MNSNENPLAKLASDLTDRVEALEKENAELRKEVQAKTASQQVVQVAPVISDEVAQATCDALVKAGALNEDQVEQTKKAFIEDPEAAHRTICGILDAQAQSKRASEDSEADLSGGKLVTGSMLSKSAEEDCLDRMQSILGM
jgi:hypothetical protein